MWLPLRDLMSDSAFRKLTLIEQMFKDLIWDPGIRAGQISLEGELPFFALPGIKQIEEGVIRELSDWVFYQFVLSVDLAAIKLVNHEHQSAYDSASEHLSIVAIEKGIDSDEFKKAREDAKIALSRFTHFNG